MNLKHLEFFAVVAQYGSINKAAQALYISQPYLSHIIRDIENDVGLKLFERTKQGVALTTEGEHFLEHSRIIVQEMDTLKKLSRKLPPDRDRLSISMTRFSHTMESFIQVCRDKQNLDHFTYRLNEGTTVEVIDEVVSGMASAGVIHYTNHMAQEIISSMSEKGLQIQPIAQLIPHIVISKSHELIRQNKEVTLANLSNYGFVRYLGQYEDFIYNIATENHQLDLNESPKITYVYGRAALLHLIASSDFYTIGIQEFSTQKSMYDILSVPIENCTERLVFAVITPKDAVLSPSVREFIADLTERYRKMEAEQSM